jgi:hypothetical protein
MIITKRDVKETSEQIQEDLLCLLDSLPQAVQTAACQIVVDRMKPLTDKAKEIPS